MRFLLKLSDNRKTDSLSTRFRKRRFRLFRSLVDSIPRPLRILDVGGTQDFWEKMGFTGEPGVDVTILNIKKVVVKYPGFSSVPGDARDLGRFGDGEFDIVFSNSTIEHLGKYEDQKKMASEVARVGKRYFVQTPNLFFPIEPHFLFPFFQFFPMGLRIFLATNFELGWYKKFADTGEAKKRIESIRLLSKKELGNLFVGSTIKREKFLFLTKSFMVIGGGDALKNDL
jgi:hypothetical protein